MLSNVPTAFKGDLGSFRWASKTVEFEAQHLLDRWLLDGKFDGLESPGANSAAVFADKREEALIAPRTCSSESEEKSSTIATGHNGQATPHLPHGS